MKSIVGLLFLIGTFAAGILTWRKRGQSRRRMVEIEAGKRCLSCDALRTTALDEQIVCTECGYTTTLAELRAHSVTEGELRAMTDVEGRTGVPS